MTMTSALSPAIRFTHSFIGGILTATLIGSFLLSEYPSPPTPRKIISSAQIALYLQIICKIYQEEEVSASGLQKDNNSSEL